MASAVADDLGQSSLSLLGSTRLSSRLEQRRRLVKKTWRGSARFRSAPLRSRLEQQRRLVKTRLRLSFFEFWKGAQVITLRLLRCLTSWDFHALKVLVARWNFDASRVAAFLLVTWARFECLPKPAQAGEERSKA
jgi:hypothetical protein